MLNFIRKVSLLKLVLLFTVGFLIYYYDVNNKDTNQVVSISGPAESLVKGFDKEVKNMTKENKNTIASTENKVQSSVKYDDSAGSNGNVTARVLGIDEDQYQGMKEDYFCDLAITARENCELQPRSEESMEICLKMGGYFTNSRHCGYQP